METPYPFVSVDGSTVDAMRIPLETVQVELVSSWWSQVLPVAALLISLFSVALTLVFRYFDRLNLRVTAEWVPVRASMAQLQPFTGQDVVLVEVTNRSRTATTEVSRLTLRTNEKRALGSSIRAHRDDVELPVTLGPGQTASLTYSAKLTGQLLAEAPGVTWVRAMAVSGHKTVLGKKLKGIVGDLRKYGEDNP